MINTPNQINIEEDGTVRLWYGESEAKPLDGAYFMRGGICWPGELTRAPFEESQVGFVVVAGIRSGGKDSTRQTIEILAETSFTTCRNVVENNRMLREGIAPWMARVLGTLGCRMYYTPRSVGRAELFIKEIRRAKWDTTRAVRFLNVDDNLDETIGLLVDAQNERRLRYEEGGALHQAMRDYKASQGNAIGAALGAAARLCAGIKKQPPRLRASKFQQMFGSD